jgi:hypothetical protein
MSLSPLSRRRRSRRDPLLPGIERDLIGRECQFLVPPLEVRTAPRPDFITGNDKYHRLAELAAELPRAPVGGA